jgi:hypothetical protein
MSATRDKIEYRYSVGSLDEVTQLYAYKVAAGMPGGFVRLVAPGGKEFHTLDDSEFKRTKKEAWAEAAKRTKEELAERMQEFEHTRKRLGVLERRLKIQQEKAK